MLRKATNADIEKTAEIFLQLHDFHVKERPDSFRPVPTGFFRGRLEWYVREDNAEVLVSDEGGINAFAAVKLLNVEAEEKLPRRLCYVDCFAVDERCRRQGVGRRLMEYIGKFARENGCTSVQLGVAAFNETAKQFYQALGFTPRTFIMEQKINNEKEH